MEAELVGAPTDELFDGAEYEVPFPQADGHTVNRLVIRLRGNIEQNRNDPDQTAFVEALRLGKYVALTCTASVSGKTQTFAEDAEGAEVVTHLVTLRVHEVSAA